MFTGLITAIGTIAQLDPLDGGRVMTITMPWTDVGVGESIAVDGACLTVESVAEGAFTVKVVATTLPRTTFGARRVGDRVNLERALRLGDRLGGHWVQGHIDGVGTVEQVEGRDDVVLIDVRLPPQVADVTIPLGSLAVAGVSLTVNAMPAASIAQVSIVPHTLQQTTLGDLTVGARVHLEGDLVGKYLRGMAAPRHSTEAAR